MAVALAAVVVPIEIAIASAAPPADVGSSTAAWAVALISGVAKSGAIVTV
jgi:hypothetical protein